MIIQGNTIYSGMRRKISNGDGGHVNLEDGRGKKMVIWINPRFRVRILPAGGWLKRWTQKREGQVSAEAWVEEWKNDIFFIPSLFLVIFLSPVFPFLLLPSLFLLLFCFHCHKLLFTCVFPSKNFVFLWIRSFNRRKVLHWETTKNRFDIPLTPRRKAAAAPTVSSPYSESNRLKQGSWSLSFYHLCQKFWVLWDFTCLISFSSFPRMYL